MKLIICRPPKRNLRKPRLLTARTKRISNHDMLTVVAEWESKWRAKHP